MADEKLLSVLFVCRENSARSQMAERYLRFLAGGRCRAESAGAEPVPINPLAVTVMKEIGLDISMQNSKSVGHFNDIFFDYVVTICHVVNEECPDPSAKVKKIRWNMEDPSLVMGSDSEKINAFRKTRDDILQRVMTLAVQELKISVSET
ncbi:MAG: arsenate reductase ArsC [Candidatus Omnitrophica bacterium]|nr:arsenate reductase ArsC [Candidatus Omnitrophota bacterium]MDD5671605.1 arsenate reductase ArsC [Candidatus Omnitrophota bacterium]